MSTAISKTCMVQGRIVFTIGDLFKGDVAKVFGTQNPKLNKQGQQFREYGFGLAVPKSVLSQCGPGQPGEIWAAIHEVAYTMFPSRQIPPTFKMKYKDGDTGTNQDGTPLNTREGYPGHLVFICKTTIPPKFFKYENGNNILVNEGIKCGDYVNVQLSININTGVNAGLYLNPNAVQFLGYGKEIVNTPSGDQLFGTAAPVLPPGASATPIAPQGMLVPQTPAAAPGQPPAPQAYPQTPQGYPQQAPAPAAQPYQPHYGVLPPVHQPQAAPAPGVPAGNPYPAQPAAPPMPGQAPMGYPPAATAAPAYPSNPGMPPMPGQYPPPR